MPKGPRGEKRPADAIGRAIKGLFAVPDPGATKPKRKKPPPPPKE